MRRRGAGDEATGSIEVELLDVDGLDAPVVERHRVQHRADPRWRHGLRLVGVAMAVGVVAGVVVLNVTEARQDSERRWTLAGRPGALTPMGEPTVTWTAAGSVPVGAVGDVILLSRAGALDAVDAVTGAVLWTRPRATGEQCMTDEDAIVADVVTCLVQRRPRVDLGTGTVELTALDPATGAELATAELPGVLLEARVVDGDTVVLLAQEDEHLEVVRWDPVIGGSLWTYRSQVTAVNADGSGVQLVRWGSDELVLGAQGWFAIDLATGAETARAANREERFGWQESVALADGSTATWQAGLNVFGIPFQDGAVVRADGTVRFALPAPVWGSDIDDGSVPGVVLVLSPGSTSELRGIDATTGEELWVAESLLVRQALARVDGMAIVRDGSAVVGVRISDGREVWRVSTERRADIEAPTDGEVILFVRQDAQGRFVAAHRVQDGMEVWREPLQTDADITAVAGRLLVVGRFGVTALG